MPLNPMLKALCKQIDREVAQMSQKGLLTLDVNPAAQPLLGLLDPSLSDPIGQSYAYPVDQALSTNIQRNFQQFFMALSIEDRSHYTRAIRNAIDGKMAYINTLELKLNYLQARIESGQNVNIEELKQLQMELKEEYKLFEEALPQIELVETLLNKASQHRPSDQRSSPPNRLSKIHQLIDQSEKLITIRQQQLAAQPSPEEQKALQEKQKFDQEKQFATSQVRTYKGNLQHALQSLAATYKKNKRFKNPQDLSKYQNVHSQLETILKDWPNYQQSALDKLEADIATLPTTDSKKQSLISTIQKETKNLNHCVTKLKVYDPNSPLLPTQASAVSPAAKTQKTVVSSGPSESVLARGHIDSNELAANPRLEQRVQQQTLEQGSVSANLSQRFPSAAAQAQAQSHEATKEEEASLTNEDPLSIYL